MRVGLIGAGNMAAALARGWGEPVLCSDSGSGRAQALVDELGGEVLSNEELAERADLVVLCHKPAQLGAVANQIRERAKAIASVLGMSPADVWGAFSPTPTYPGTPVFYLIPNTPVAIRRGVTCYVPAPDVDEHLEAEVITLFERLGRVVRVPVHLIGPAAAVSSVGPAYQALLAEAQVDAAVRHGLAASLASELVAETMSGTAALLAARNYDTLSVRREVTSPAGSTARGLAALERGGVRAAFAAAMDAVIRGEK